MSQVLSFKLTKQIRKNVRDTTYGEILNHYAPRKQTKLYKNTKPHVNKILRKEIMKKSRLKNRTGSKDLKLYKIQRML